MPERTKSSAFKMSGKEMDDNKYSHEIQRLSNEILRDKSLPNQIYSQSLVKVMQEKSISSNRTVA